MIRPASRMENIPPYLFLELDRMIKQQKDQGYDVISLGVGDPDQPTPAPIIAALKNSVDNPSTHRYPDYQGSLAFREAISSWYQRRFNVAIQPETEAIGLIGSKEGIAHIIWAMAEPGDIVLVPDPAYPVYYTQTILAGAEPYAMPLKAERNFLPDLSAIPTEVLRRAKMLWINYPNNPTGAIAPLSFLEEAVDLCRRYDILLCSDAAYAEIGFNGYRAPSILQIPGAKEVAIEFYSLSKPFNMTGWRLAAAVGNTAAVQALTTMKSNVDSGPFGAVQDAGIAALQVDPFTAFHALNSLYQTRRDLVLSALDA
ncbi:MAG: aminotransferase class I/II-fold pyridoxal phosphate-dependent enzyme, partial [Firmicutes bacterium]|nr:aminotransferase class I/II-fold pyridoxal phosphate-dependent enzyme [Bacillota bacterium]